VQVGQDIDGEAADDESGFSVSLSSDGRRVAIGATGNDGNGDFSGHVRLYDWNGSSWVQVGLDIDGEAADDESGRSVSLSSDGRRVAIGAPFNAGNGNNSGQVRIYNTVGGTFMDEVEVFALPAVAFTAPAPDVCVEDAVQTGLGGGTPTGGVYSGTGVTDDGNGMTFSFDPTASATAGGNISVTYTFTDGNGCNDSASDDIFVDPICNQPP
jgi:hypothetical protein